MAKFDVEILSGHSSQTELDTIIDKTEPVLTRFGAVWSEKDHSYSAPDTVIPELTREMGLLGATIRVYE